MADGSRCEGATGGPMARDKKVGNIFERAERLVFQRTENLDSGWSKRAVMVCFYLLDSAADQRRSGFPWRRPEKLK